MAALCVLCDVCEIFTSSQELSDPNIVFCLGESLTPEEQKLLRAGLNRIGCERCDYCGGERGENAPLMLWVEPEAELRRELTRWVQLKAEYRASSCWPEDRKKLRVKVRALIREILSLRKPSGSKAAMPKGNRRGQAKHGRKPSLEIAERNQQAIRLFDAGKSINEVCEHFGISAALARKIKSNAGRSTGNEAES